MKKIFVLILVLLSVAIFGLLIFFRLNKKEHDVVSISKIITPTAKIKKIDAEGVEENSATSQTTPIPLEAGETFIVDCDTDLNVDGADDKVLAVWLNADNSVYLIPAISNPIQKKYARNAGVKTEITQPNSVAIYTLDLELGEKPAVVCSGTTRDNIQILAIFLLDENGDGSVTLRQVAVFHADIQIRIEKNERARSTGLGLYSVLCFEFDSSNPNTLTQIEKIYTWSERDGAFQKTAEVSIPGEKVESQMLRRIGGGDVQLFREFLQGLWVQQNENTNTATEKLLYFNSTANEITFTNGDLQEIYVISNVNQRRYGIYFTTYNKSLNTIILRIDIEIKSLTEISVRVVESVTRLKIGAESLWDGVYAKKDNTIRVESESSQLTRVELILRTENVSWKNDSYDLHFEKNAFTFKTPSGILSGDYTLLTIQNKTILQLRSRSGTYFYEVTPANTALILTQVEVKLTTVKNTGTEKIVLVKTQL